MKLFKNKTISIFAVIAIIMFAFVAPVSAEEINTSTANTLTPIEKVENNNNDLTINNTGNADSNLPGNLPTPDNTLPNVTTEEMAQKIEGKVSEISTIMKRVMSALCVVVFLIGAGKTLLGTIGHRGGWGYGVIAMVITAVMYACINYAEDIINFITAWLIS